MRRNVFVLFATLFIITTAGHIYTIDGYLNYAVTGSIARHGTVEIPKFMMTVEGRDGRHYSKLGIGQSLVSVVPYWIGSLAEGLSPRHPLFRAYSTAFTIPHEEGAVTAQPQTLIRASDQDGAKVFFVTLTNGFVSALLCVLFWLVLKDFQMSERSALWGAVLLAFGTPLWVYSRDLFAEPLFAVCLLGTFFFLRPATETGRRRSILLGGLLSSLGILVRASFIPLVAIFALYLVLTSRVRERWTGGRAYVLSSLPGMIIFALLNLHKFGSVLSTGYHTAFDKGFSVSLVQGLAWNLGSPYRSIFLYAPAVFLFVLGCAGFARRYRRDTWLITSIVVYMFLVYSKWWAWHGGWCWGPRFFLPVIPLLLLPGLVEIGQGRRCLSTIAIALGIIGFTVQLSGVLINYTVPYDYWIKTGKLDWSETDIHLLSPIYVHLRALAATHPADYDLWVVQAFKAIGWYGLWIILGLAAIITCTARRIRKDLVDFAL
jgi:hypothetical protein